MVEVLIAGDSQTGALMHRVRRLRNVGLVAAPGKSFADIHVTDAGQVEGYKVQINCPQGAPLDRYDLVYIYGDMPEPLALIPRRAHRFSRAYLAAHVSERLHDCHSLTLAQQVAQVLPTDRIILVPKPINLKRGANGFAEMTLAQATALIAPHIGFPIAPLKSKTCAADGTPDPACYEKSADWQGAATDASTQPDHDNGHLNTRGGDLVFDAFKRDVARRVIPAHENRHRSSPPAHPTPPPPL